jgi:hypothetical protein
MKQCSERVAIPQKVEKSLGRFGKSDRTGKKLKRRN